MMMKRAFLLLTALSITSSAFAGTADEYIAATGLKGGLAVVIGCDDTDLLKELGRSGFTVQALDVDPARVAQTRRSLKSAQLYGRVSAVQFDGEALPYAGNLVNAILIPDSGSRIPDDEIKRVLAPRGTAIARRKASGIWRPAPGIGDGYVAFSKPVPGSIDDWPMHLYGPGNNAVSRDTAVGPPERLQWRSGPTWTRSHEYASSLNAMVSMNGKLFYVMDEGSRLSPVFAERWKLVCQDAFNGVILWKRDLPSWHTHWWPVKSGPTQAMRRLVALEDKLYVPLGVGAPLHELDAGTGETIRSFAGTGGIEEVRIAGDTIHLLTSDAVAEQQKFNLENVEVWGAAGDATGDYRWDDRKRAISAIDMKSGRTLWTKDYPVMTLSLTLDAERLYFHDGTRVVALDRTDGRELWTSEELAIKKYKLGTATAPSLLTHDGVVVCSDGFDFKDGNLLALDARTGRTLWKKAHQPSGHSSPDDIHIVDGLLWEAGIARIGKQGGTYRGFDPKTGELKREFPLDVEHGSWFHQRCYRSRATGKYIIPAATGIEYVDVRKEHWETHHWVRGACLYGVLPANGLTYATPHPCACFMESMVRGFSALAPEATDHRPQTPDRRLEKGPAYETIGGNGGQASPRAEDWSTYRRDPSRSGYARTDIGAKVERAWAAEVASGRITPPVSAGGMVFVAATDQHTVYALGERDGGIQWTFTAGGRIDSPPTIYRGTVIFGCADGHVYCLAADKGELAWKLRAAPAVRMIASDGQIESAWPVHGSVLIVRDRIYALAGRSLFLDGGMHLNIINPRTGELISSVKHDGIDPDTGNDLQLSKQGLKMAPANSDLLSFDGEHIYMKAQRIGLDGKRIFPETGKRRKEYTLSKSQQEGEGAHLFSPPGFLDTAWHHRSYWLYGKAAGSGWGGWMKPGKYVPAGRILVVDEDRNVFGFGREPAFFAQSHVMEYQLFGARGGVYQREDWQKVFKSIKDKEASITNWQKNRALPIEKMSAVRFSWRNVNPPLLVRAMAGANDKLVVAGPPDVLDETRLHGRFLDPEVQRQIDRQEDAVNGRMGGIMWIVSAADGSKLSELE
ncbi:MAG: outer membrane protein assembly factor BamB family protein, partial [Planctomycetota bacterium]